MYEITVHEVSMRENAMREVLDPFVKGMVQ